MANAKIAAGGSRRPLGDEVHCATDRIAAVERGCSALRHLDALRAIDVGLIQRVVVKDAQGPNGNPILQVLVDGIRADGLPNAHAVLLVAKVIPEHAWNSVQDLAQILDLVGIPGLAIDRADRRGGLREWGLHACACDHNSLLGPGRDGHETQCNSECNWTHLKTGDFRLVIHRNPLQTRQRQGLARRRPSQSPGGDRRITR